MTSDGELLDAAGHKCNHTGKPAAPAREYYRGETYEKVVSVKDPDEPNRILRDAEGEVVEKVVTKTRLIDGPKITIGVQAELFHFCLRHL